MQYRKPLKTPLKALEANRKWVAQNKERHRRVSRDRARRYKTEAIEHYGGACACCGEDEMAFLTLDHIIPLKSGIRRDGGSQAFRLYQQDYPAGFQVLCYNCNCAKRTDSECPHRLLVKRKLMLVGGR